MNKVAFSALETISNGSSLSDIQTKAIRAALAAHARTVSLKKAPIGSYVMLKNILDPRDSNDDKMFAELQKLKSTTGLVVGANSKGRIAVVLHLDNEVYGEYCLADDWYTTIPSESVVSWKVADLARTDFLCLRAMIKDFFKYMEMSEKNLAKCQIGSFVRLPNRTVGVLAFPGKDFANVFGTQPVGRHYEIGFNDLQLVPSSELIHLPDAQKMELQLLHGYIATKFIRELRFESKIVFDNFAPLHQLWIAMPTDTSPATTKKRATSDEPIDGDDAQKTKKAKQTSETTTTAVGDNAETTAEKQ